MNRNSSAVSTEPRVPAPPFRPLRVGVQVRFQELRLRRQERAYLTALADDRMQAGMFLPTSHTYSKGRTIEIEFETRDGEVTPVRASAVVCWRHRWRAPRGMGIRFIEFAALGTRRLESWIDTVLAPGSIDA